MSTIQVVTGPHAGHAEEVDGPLPPEHAMWDTDDVLEQIGERAEYEDASWHQNLHRLVGIDPETGDGLYAYQGRRG